MRVGVGVGIVSFSLTFSILNVSLVRFGLSFREIFSLYLLILFNVILNVLFGFAVGEMVALMMNFVFVDIPGLGIFFITISSDDLKLTASMI